MTDETKSKKPKYDFLCKTNINANSYCKKDVKPSVNRGKMVEKRLPGIKIELDLYRTTKRPYRNLKINGLSTSP